MNPRLSSETIHASCVSIDDHAVLITGPSGSGKSDLSLRLLDRGFALVSDDQTILKRVGTHVVAAAPTTIRGKLEIRGLGILNVDVVDDIPVALAVELTSDVTRLPDDGRQRAFLGVAVPLVSVDAKTASAASKVALALDRLGLKF